MINTTIAGVEAVSVSVADDTVMRAYVARPKGKPTSGVIVLQEAFGIKEYIQRVTLRFAQQGYVAIAPELFHRTAPPGFIGSYGDYHGVQPHMQALTDETLTLDIQAAFDWLQKEHDLSRRNIAAVGFCMGGRAAFLANCELSLGAAVSFYGGGIAQSLLSRAKDVVAPQLLIWGGKDTHITPEHRRSITDVLTAANKDFVTTTFSEGGHGFACDARDAYHASSARLAWALTDAFLTEHLIP